MRNTEREQETILNGNRYVVNTNEHTGVFLRDVDKLLHQYTNLRLSIYNQYKNYLPDPVSQSELKSYIDEQFVRLVKEYDINGPVDFPGYIKKKLTYRVKHSYIKGSYRDRQRVFVPKNEFDISNLMDKTPMMDEELDYYEALEYALSDVKLDELEKEVLFLMLQEMSDAEIERNIRKKFEVHKRRVGTKHIRKVIEEMKTFLKTRLQESSRSK